MPEDDRNNTFDKSEYASNLFTNTTDFIDRHIRIFKYSSYAVAAVGAVVILRNTHAFRRFGRISEIPSEFVQKRVQLRGSVQIVDDHGTIHLHHIPIFKVPFSKNPTPSKLPVRVASVDMSEDGISWLQRTLTGQNIWFRLLARDEEHIHCIVKCKKNWYRNMVINHELVNQGLASVSHVPSLPVNRDSDRLTRHLVAAEIKAEKKGRGIWERPTLSERLRTLPRQISDNVTSDCREKVQNVKTRLGFSKPKLIGKGDAETQEGEIKDEGISDLKKSGAENKSGTGKNEGENDKVTQENGAKR